MNRAEAGPPHALDAVLRPRSVAIIGASADPSKRGHLAVRALLEGQFPGRIIPVHPAGGTLLGLPVARGPSDLDAAPDLILVCTPAGTVPAVLDEWAAAGSRGAVVLASGFAESGDAGRRLEDDIRRVAGSTGIRVAGPNTSGLINVRLGLNLIGIRGVRAGGLGLLVQSGNLTLQLITEATARTEEGFSFCIGVGNETDIRFDEYLAFLVHDPSTRALMVHAEGFRDGRRFVDALREASFLKPIVFLKGARTLTGGAAARSHTGAVAGSYALLRAGLGRAGVLEVTRTDELLHVAETLARQPACEAGRGIALLSDGGGHAALAMDTLHELGAPLAQLGDLTRDRLRSLLGNAAAVGNPVDLAGAADRSPAVFARTLEVLLTDAGVGGVLVVGLFGGYAIRFAETLLDEETAAAETMAAHAQRCAVPLVLHSLYAHTRSRPLRTLSAAGVPVVESLEVACRCIHAAAARGLALKRPRADSAAANLPAAPAPAATAAVKSAMAEHRGVLLEPEARAILAAHGVPMVSATLCTTRAQTAASAEQHGQPVAIRIVSPAAPHKTEAGGVALGVQGGEAAGLAFDRVTAAVTAWAGVRGVPADIRGVLVSPMQSPPLAALIVGAMRDPQFGAALTIGAGGTAVEVWRDVGHVLLPATDDEIREMILSLRIAPILEGLRGKPGAEMACVIRAAAQVGQALLAHEAIGEIEINPLFVYPDRCVALDARAYLLAG
jgi:acetyltransferase